MGYQGKEERKKRELVKLGQKRWNMDTEQELHKFKTEKMAAKSTQGPWKKSKKQCTKN